MEVGGELTVSLVVEWKKLSLLSDPPAPPPPAPLRSAPLLRTHSHSGNFWGRGKPWPNRALSCPTARRRGIREGRRHVGTEAWKPLH
ncbi:hypothetical protein INR49_025293 [Caranx melampygus]|nr:hypothetical protein INR49_025293 [Caranx melampygus]